MGKLRRSCRGVEAPVHIEKLHLHMHGTARFPVSSRQTTMAHCVYYLYIDLTEDCQRLVVCQMMCQR